MRAAIQGSDPHPQPDTLMSAVQKEPAMLAGTLAGVVNAALALAVANGWLDSKQAGLWGTFLLALAAFVLPALQGWWTRSRVFSPNTIREAGLDPADVARAADDPSVTPHSAG